MLFDVCTDSAVNSDISFDRWSDGDLSFDIPDVADSFNTDTIPYREAIKTRELELVNRAEDLERKKLMHTLITLAITENLPDRDALKSELSQMDYDELKEKAFGMRKIIYCRNSTDTVMSYVSQLCSIYELIQQWIEQYINPGAARALQYIIKNFNKHEDKARRIAMMYFQQTYTEEIADEETIWSALVNFLMLILFGGSIQNLIAGDADLSSMFNSDNLRLL